MKHEWGKQAFCGAFNLMVRVGLFSKRQRRVEGMGSVC